MLRLLPATDAHYAWMLGEADAPDSLRLPPGGVDTPPILRWLRRTLPKLGGNGMWLMVAGGEVVGTCGYKWPPTQEGVVEVGYGVASARRGLGYAGEASRLIIEAARLDPRVRALVAETAVGNVISQRVLVANGFFKTGRGYDDEEGEMVRWRLDLASPTSSPVPAGLLSRRLDALYTTADGRMVTTNEWEPRPAPRFHLMLAAEGPMFRVGRDVPDHVAQRLGALAADERWDPNAKHPANLADYLALLEAHAPAAAVWSGPARAC